MRGQAAWRSEEWPGGRLGCGDVAEPVAPTLARSLLVSSASKAITSKPLSASHPLPAVSGQVTAGAGPRSRSRLPAQGRRGYHGALDVVIAHVAEDAAQQQHVGEQRVGEDSYQARIRLADLTLRKALWPGVLGLGEGPAAC